MASFRGLPAQEARDGQDQQAAETDIRVRMSFSAKQPRRWVVAVALLTSDGKPATNGWLDEIENHSTSVETVAATRLESDGRRLEFRPRFAVAKGAVQFRIRGPRDAKLLVEPLWVSEADGEVRGATQIVALETLCEGKPIESPSAGPIESPSAGDADGEATEWKLQREVRDALRVELTTRSRVLQRDSALSCSIRVNALKVLASKRALLRYELVRVSDGRAIATESWPIAVDAAGNAEPRVITQATPEQAGVYEIRCAVEASEDEFWSRLPRLRGRDATVVRSGEPFLVLPQTVNGEATKAWTVVDELRPSHTATWSVSRWLPQGLIPGSSPTQELGRETYEGRGVSVIKPGRAFQATLPVRSPSLPHLVTLRYPVDQAMRLQVEIARAGGMDRPVKSFVVGGPPPQDSGQPWTAHTFVHYPRPDDQIRLTNLDDALPVAFEVIEVRAGNEHIAAPKPYDTHHRVACYQLRDLDWVDAFANDVEKIPSVAHCQPATVALYKLWLAADRLRDHAVANGMNAVAVPAISAGRAWIDTRAFDPLRHNGPVDAFSLEVFLSLMDRGNLKVFLTVDQSTPLRQIEASIASDPNSSEPWLYRVRNQDGGISTQYNIFHPAVGRALADLIEQVHEQAAGHFCYAGIELRAGVLPRVSRGEVSKRDALLPLFAQSQHAAERSSSRLKSWVEGQGRAAFDDWLQDRTAKLYRSLARPLGHRPLLVDSAADPLRVDRDSVVGGNVLRVTDFARHSTGRLSSQLERQQSWITAEEGLAPATVVRLGDKTAAAQPEIPVIREQTFSDVSRIVSRFNPAMLVFESSGRCEGLSPKLSRLLKAFSQLPVDSLEPVKAADRNAQWVSLRQATDGQRLIVMVANHAPWATDIQWETPPDTRWTPLVGTDSEDATVIVQDRTASLTVPPGGCLLFQTEGSAVAKIAPYSATVSGGAAALDQIKEQVATIVSRLGTLERRPSIPMLSNGGFEQTGGVGLVGWLHAQHPPDSVRVVDGESYSGKRSVLLATDSRLADRTWIVSEPFAAPHSGRLAVSLACRSELRGNGQEHRLRVSIEGAHEGEPMRHSAEIQIATDGKWQARSLVLEVDGVDPGTFESLRLSIDSLSSGRVWIDDVQLHDEFPLAKERSALQSQAFLAVQGLQRGNLTPSAVLLQNHWAQLLLAEQASDSPLRQPGADSETKSPGVAERLRGWLPRRFRF